MCVYSTILLNCCANCGSCLLCCLLSGCVQRPRLRAPTQLENTGTQQDSISLFYVLFQSHFLVCQMLRIPCFPMKHLGINVAGCSPHLTYANLLRVCYTLKSAQGVSFRRHYQKVFSLSARPDKKNCVDSSVLKFSGWIRHIQRAWL